MLRGCKCKVWLPENLRLSGKKKKQKLFKSAVWLLGMIKRRKFKVFRKKKKINVLLVELVNLSEWYVMKI